MFSNGIYYICTVKNKCTLTPKGGSLAKLAASHSFGVNLQKFTFLLKQLEANISTVINVKTVLPFIFAFHDSSDQYNQTKSFKAVEMVTPKSVGVQLPPNLM